MNTAQVIDQAIALRERIQSYQEVRRGGSPIGQPQDAAKAQVCEFLRQYAGPKSAFLKEAEAAQGYAEFMITTLSMILNWFVEYTRAGLSTTLSPERQAQVDVVSDILSQAQAMLDTDGYHPAAAAVLIGASLEEY